MAKSKQDCQTHGIYGHWQALTTSHKISKEMKDLPQHRRDFLFLTLHISPSKCVPEGWTGHESLLTKMKETRSYMSVGCYVLESPIILSAIAFIRKFQIEGRSSVLMSKNGISGSIYFIRNRTHMVRPRTVLVMHLIDWLIKEFVCFYWANEMTPVCASSFLLISC